MDIENLYELMFDNVQDALFLIDVDHSSGEPTFVYIRLNDSYEKKTGIDNEFLAGNTPGEVFDEQTAEELNSNYMRCLNSRDTIRYVEELDLPTGSGTWKTHLTPLVKNDRVEAMLGATRDITEEMSRRRELQFFREAMNQNPDEIYIVDPDTAQFLDVTESVVDMLGYTKQELLTMHAQDLDPDLAGRENWEEFVEEIKDEGPKTFETTHRRKDGKTFPVEAHVDYITVQNTKRIIATARDITDRKKTQDQIKSQEQFLRMINNQLPGVTFQFKRSPDGTYSFPYVSEGLIDLCGITNQTVMRDSSKLFDLIHPDDVEDVWTSIEESANQINQWQNEARVNHPENGIRWLRATSTPKKLDDGSIIWSGVLIDVSNEKKKQIELNKQKARFQTLFENAPIGLLEEDWSDAKSLIESLNLSDPEQLHSYMNEHPDFVREIVNEVDIQLVNETLVEITGADDKTHLFNSFEELLSDELYDQVQKQAVGMWQGERTCSSIFTLHRLDGGKRHILRELRIVPEFEDDWSKVFVSYQDVTERKRMEESLRDSEQRYRTLFEDAREAFLIKSLDDRILDANKSAGKLLGYHPDELVGKNMKAIMPEEVVQNCGCDGIVKFQLEQFASSIFNWTYQNREGSTVPVEKSFTTIEYHGQNAVLASVRDRSEIEHLRKKDQRKSSFVSQVTHDLRTPLNSISGMAELMNDTDLTGKQRQYLQTILNASRNMERLTNDILDLNRIERDELTLDEEPFNVERLIEEVISLYSQEVNDRDILLSKEVSEGIPEQLIGDPKHIKQILHNLVDNSIKHTQEGSIQIKVQKQGRRGEHVVLSFSVSDTGRGIPDSELNHIFEEHMQVGDDTSGTGNGLGLGLSICRNFIEMMNGEIDVESELGEGTTITFTIELQEMDTTEQEETPSVALKNLNVLLVEDNALIRKVVRAYLDSHDITVVERESGEAALEELLGKKTCPYDVVFLDRRLQDMSGVDVFKKVADEQEAIDPERIYLISGDPPEKINELIEPTSCAGVLEKPVDESTLINSIASVVAAKSNHGEQQETEALRKNIQTTAPNPFHILVVDDDKDARTLLYEILTPIADDLTFVKNGEEAVEKRFEESPDLIFMDLQLPEMDGLEAIKRIREKEVEQELPSATIISQTAMAMKHVEEECLDAGADKFMRKPINPGSLYRSILDVL